MITALSKLFIKNREDTRDPSVRRAYGMLSSICGISLNVILFAIKYIAGTLSGSIAITADAFNNLSDAGSSIITLVGFKLAGASPDTEHPFGHGRIEYVSGFVVSILILFMGYELAKSSIQKIISPENILTEPLTLTILAVSILIKLYMYAYNRRLGKKLNSAAILATATDSISDCVATCVILLATAFTRFTGIVIDGWCGIAVALFILRAGILAAKDTLSPLLGQPPSPDLVREIEEIVLSHPEITGIHDLIVHDYGPGRMMITLHVEVPGHGDLNLLHDVVDGIERELSQKFGCLATIHMDPLAYNDEKTHQLLEELRDIAASIDPEISVHDFRMVVGPTHTNLIFDAVVPYHFRLSDREVADRFSEAVAARHENYFCVCSVERSYV